MAELEQLIKALKAADAAGDTQSATVLSQAIRQAQSVSRETVGTPAPPLAGDGTDLNWTDQGYQEAVTPPPNRGGSTLLPMSMNEQGEPVFDSDEGILGVMKRAVHLPGQAYRGEFDPTSPEAIPRMLEGASVMTPMGAASRVSGGMLAPKSAFREVAQPAPTREALKAAKTEQYKKAADMGVEYKAESVKRVFDDFVDYLDKEAYFETVVPELRGFLKDLRTVPAGQNPTVRLEALEAVRRRFGEMAGNVDKTKASAATQAIRVLDDFLTTADASAVVGVPSRGGPTLARKGHDFTAADAAATEAHAAEAAATLESARGNAAAGFRSKQIGDLEEVMRLRSGAANSGLNIDNTGRQKLVSMLTNSGGKGIRGFNEAEKSAIEDIIMGTPSKNAARYFGNIMGGGGGIGQSLMMLAPAGAVGASGGGAGTILASMLPGAAGAVAKRAANKLTQNQIKALDNLIRSRSPLGAATGGAQQVYRPGITQDTMLKALLAEGIGGQPMPNQNMQNALGAK